MVASNIPRIGRGNDSRGLTADARTFVTPAPKAGKSTFAQSLARTGTPAVGASNACRPSGDSATVRRTYALTPMARREPPAPRPAQAGRGYVGTSIPPPRSFRSESQDKQSAILYQSRAALWDAAKTPSLVSSSSVSTVADSPRSNTVQRKASANEFEISSSPRTAIKDSLPEAVLEKDGYPNAVFGISVPAIPADAPSAPETDILNLDQYMAEQPSFGAPTLAATPLYPLTATPSTRYSPGPFSVSSTPTTMSCYSPATNVTTSRPSLTLERQLTPVELRLNNIRKTSIDNIARRDAKSALPARQSSSSSGSTVKVSEDGSRLRSPIELESQSASRLTRSKLRIGNENKRPATLQKKAPSVPLRPPEFAHLADASPLKRLVPPRPQRPSREGTPEIGLRNPQSVVQSNMSSLPSAAPKGDYIKQPLQSESTAAITKSRFGLSRKATPRQSSPALALSISTTLAEAQNTQAVPKDKQAPLSADSNVEKLQSRFGLFRRANTFSPEKRLRKAPMANSGHEVYSKFGIRNRSGSSTSGNTSAGRSSSTSSARVVPSHPNSRKSSVGSKRGSVTDDFVAQRLSPVKLRGMGPISDRTDADSSSKTSSVAVTGSSVSLQGAGSSSTDVTSQIAAGDRSSGDLSGQHSSNVNADAVSVTQQTHDKQRHPVQPGSAHRSSRRSMIDALSSMTIAEDTKTEYQFSSHPVVNPLARNMSEPLPTNNSAASIDSPVRQSSAAEPIATTPRLMRKWNFIWNNRSANKVDPEVPPEAVAVSVPAYVPTKRGGHYAIQDIPREINVLEIEKIMQEAEILDDNDEAALVSEPETTTSNVRLGDLVLLPELPSLVPAFALPPRPSSPKVNLQSLQSPARQQISELPIRNIDRDAKSPPEVLPNVRPSRLAQVGRIPRVVSKRDRDRKPPGASFSRPFHVLQPSPASNSPLLRDSSEANDSPVFQGPFLGQSPKTAADAQLMVGKIMSAEAIVTASPEPLDDNQITLPKSPTEGSATATSSGRSSMAPFIAPLIIPGQKPVSSVDDVWQEYDDLLDLLSAKTPKTPKTPHTGSSLGAPFQYAGYEASPVDAPMTPASLFQRKSLPSIPSMIHRLRHVSDRDSMTIRASRSFITSAPGSPISTNHLLESALDRRASALAALTGRRSLPPASRSSGGFARMSVPQAVPEASDEEDAVLPRTSQASSRPKRDSKRDSINVQTTEAQHMGFESMANLRLNALMTSKWLSFGQVLFSPAHEELQTTGEDRVLVLDGLGKDWSYWLALNYKNAMVYNLGCDPADDVDSKKTVLEKPANHQHIHHPEMSVALPFPNGYFTAVVYRFPMIASESMYKYILGECKRVLRPGGFLEISVLDMDMLNMGNEGRRALRSLKERIHREDDNVSFKSISDTMQRLLGRRGFENLNRCVVGVPAAGCIPHGSAEASVPFATNRNAALNGAQPPKMPSLGDLMRGQSPSGDEGITRIVSRVARWWYSRCYESLALAEGDVSKSIWSNKALLDECEERGTSLRLMVCFAQKPECVVRRTISV